MWKLLPTVPGPEWHASSDPLTDSESQWAVWLRLGAMVGGKWGKSQVMGCCTCRGWELHTTSIGKIGIAQRMVRVREGGWGIDRWDDSRNGCYLTLG